jgi:GxxExxY protein
MGTMINKPYVKSEYPLSDLTGKIIGAAQAVHRELGPGFRELIYQRALAHELNMCGLEFTREAWMEVVYKGESVGRQRVDFVIGDETGTVMVEIKAKAEFAEVDFVQVISYLKASGFMIGLLLNFGGKDLVSRRFIHTKALGR